MKPEKRSTLSIVLFAVYILLLIAIILFKLPFYSPQISDGIRAINLIPLLGSFDGNGDIVWSEIRNNILIFIPFGIYVCMLKSEWPLIKKVFTVCGLTLSFEVLQFLFALGRTDVTDILSNSLGGIIGIIIYAIMFKVFKNRTNKIITVLALIVTICVILRFGQLFYFSYFRMRRMRP